MMDGMESGLRKKHSRAAQTAIPDAPASSPPGARPGDRRHRGPSPTPSRRAPAQPVGDRDHARPGLRAADVSKEKASVLLPLQSAPHRRGPAAPTACAPPRPPIHCAMGPGVMRRREQSTHARARSLSQHNSKTPPPHTLLSTRADGATLLDGKPLPTSFDWRTDAPGGVRVLSPPRNQHLPQYCG